MASTPLTGRTKECKGPLTGTQRDMRGLPQRILVDGFIRKMIFKATRRKWEKFCFAGRGEIANLKGVF